MEQRKTTTKDISSLFNITSNWIVRNLAVIDSHLKYKPNAISFHELPSDVLSHLIKRFTSTLPSSYILRQIHFLLATSLQELSLERTRIDLGDLAHIIAQHCPNLERLHLNKGQLIDESILQCLLQLKRLKHLSLPSAEENRQTISNHTKLRFPFSFFSDFPSLETLNISECIMPSWTSFTVAPNNQLRTLIMDSCHLIMIPIHFDAFANLRVLSMNHNQISTLPLWFLEKLTQLEELHLADNQITYIPLEIGKLRQLRLLVLSSNLLTHLPKQLFLLPHLHTLYLDSTNISSSTPVGLSTSLTRLNMNSCYLTSLPADIQRLKQLTIANLGFNRLRSMSEITELENLEELNLTHNWLKFVPNHINKLSSLTRLNLSDNDISMLPPQFGELIALTDLDLQHNSLTSFPMEITSLIHLKKLSIGSQPLKNIPPEISCLSELECLYAHNIRLSTLPLTFSQLTKLKELTLDNNNLYEIPDLIGKLSQLEYLSASNNAISVVSSEICRCTNLRTLILRTNEITKFPFCRNELVHSFGSFGFDSKFDTSSQQF